MKKRNLLAVLFLAVLTLTMVSCNKDDDDNNNEKLDIKEVIIGNWEYKDINLSVALDINGDGVKGTNITEMKPCFSDNYYTFKESDMYAFNNGKLKCDDNDDGDIISQGTYSFNTDATSITFDKVTYTIIAFTKNTLRLSYPETFNNKDFIVTYYLERK